MEKTKYKLGSWKLSIDGEYESEEAAIKDLADEYMSRSKCDLPGEHPLEILNGSQSRDITTIGKSVWLSVYEKIHGHMQWVIKHKLTIYPFKPEHWWEPAKPGNVVPPATEFRYKIETPEN